MPRVVFTSHLQRHVDCPDSEVAATTVRAALDAVFATQPRLRGYVLDDQGRLRKHVFVFVDGRRIDAESGLDAAVAPTSEIHVLQALTGG